MIVDRIGIPADFRFGGALALLGLAAIASLNSAAQAAGKAPLTGKVRVE
jgi:hypothetical protein